MWKSEYWASKYQNHLNAKLFKFHKSQGCTIHFPNDLSERLFALPLPMDGKNKMAIEWAKGRFCSSLVRVVRIQMVW